MSTTHKVFQILISTARTDSRTLYPPTPPPPPISAGGVIEAEQMDNCCFVFFTNVLSNELITYKTK